VDTLFQAAVMGIVQGLTEFLPISSSGHLIIVPALLGWTDPFITSLAFSVMLHMGTLVALLVYFWRDWAALIPAFFASLRDRTIGADQDRRLAWLLAITTIPAIVLGVLLNDVIENNVREPGTVAVLLVIAAGIMYVADHFSRRDREAESLSMVEALGIGGAQALALFPGVSRSGISISAGRFLGLTRPAAARFSFLMAAPVIAGAGAWELLKLVRGTEPVTAAEPLVIVVGFVAALVSGLLAIHVLLRYLVGHSLNVFVVYRLVVAAIVLVWLVVR
jgi:undecaprenyl-diphosphatase